MKEYSVKATFFTPGWVAEKWPKAIEAIVSDGHEIGHHGYVHEFPFNFVAREDEELFLLRGKEALERVSGVDVVGYRPAGYMYTEHTLGLLKEHGFKYGSGMHDDDAAYVHEGGQVAEIPVKWHLVDDMFGWHIDWGLPPSLVEEHWLSELRELGRFPGRIYVPTLHPQVMGHPGRLAMFERVLQAGVELGSKFRRCRDVAEELLSRGGPSLVKPSTTADTSRRVTPSATGRGRK
jgi:peptidoglycan/xylan/chitin deacetylase (PgdA/CDA1 family)